MTSKAIWRDRAKAWQAMCESWIIFENNARNKYLQSSRWSAAWKKAAKNEREWQRYEREKHYIWANECQSARSIARRLLRERDEATLLLTDCQDRVDRYFAKITSLKSQVNHLESDRDALAKQVDELQDDYVLLQNLAGATIQAMQEVGADGGRAAGCAGAA